MQSTHDLLPSADQLEAFFGLAETLHFQEAADNLKLSQPALTRRVQSLEKMIGTLLFDRSRRSLKLTPAGLAFLESTSSWRSDLQEALRRARAVAAGERGTLSIGLVPSATI